MQTGSSRLKPGRINFVTMTIAKLLIIIESLCFEEYNVLHTTEKAGTTGQLPLNENRNTFS